MFGCTLKQISLSAVFALGISVYSGNSAEAATLMLDSSTQCSAGNASHGIAVGDVTGNAGGASDCWGAFTGNDPGPSGDGIQIGSTVYDFAVKIDFGAGGNVLEGADIGFQAVNGGASAGTWSFDQGAMSDDPFVFVVKKANKPGFAVWLFEGDDALSHSGSFSIAWKNSNDASHISIYGNPGSTITVMPLPAGGLLLVTALGSLGFASRRRRRGVK